MNYVNPGMIVPFQWNMNSKGAGNIDQALVMSKGEAGFILGVFQTVIRGAQSWMLPKPTRTTPQGQVVVGRDGIPFVEVHSVATGADGRAEEGWIVPQKEEEKANAD
jgi:hypothetical protein